MTHAPQPGDQQPDPIWSAQPPTAQPWAYPAPTGHPSDPGHLVTSGYPANPVQPVPPGYPVASGYQANQGYPPVAYPPPYGYPVQPRQTNGLAIGSMVVSLVAIGGLGCYGLGGFLGIVGAILGHVSRRQIRERGEDGDGMALAGVIMGWLATAVSVLVTIAIVGIIIFAAQSPESFSDSTF